MSQSHGIKGGATDGVFQEQYFLWKRGASVAADFDLFNFQDHWHTWEQIQNTEGKEDKEYDSFKARVYNPGELAREIWKQHLL